MENYLFTVPAHTAQTFIFASILFAILTFLPNLGHRLKVVNIPLYNGLSNDEEGKQFFITSAKKIYVDGYRQASLLKLSCPQRLKHNSLKTLCTASRHGIILMS